MKLGDGLSDKMWIECVCFREGYERERMRRMEQGTLKGGSTTVLFTSSLTGLE